MKIRNASIILFMLTFLIGVILVYLINGKVVPIGTSEFTEEYLERCWH